MELTAIYDSAPIGLAVLDTGLRFVRINQRLAEINGLPAEEHIGRTVAEVIPDIAPQAEDILKTILRTGEPLQDVEIRGIVPSQPGVERIWLEQFSPLRDESGAIVGISVVAEEITERRRLEDEVRNTQARLALALDAARIVMWEWDIPSGRVNFTFGDWLAPAEGARQLQTIEGVRESIHPDDRERSSQALVDHLEGRTPSFQCELRIRAPDGGYRWSLTRGSVTARTRDGQPRVFTAFHQDITERRGAEADRREQAQLLELASDAIFVWAKDNGIERWNRGAELLYGYSAEEVKTVPTHTLLQTQFGTPLNDILAQLEGRGQWRGELVHRTKDGRRLHVQALMQEVEGQPGRILEITRDVTSEHAAQERLADREHQLRVYKDRLDIALEAGRMGVWEWRPKDEAGYWSPQIFDLLEVDRAIDGRGSIPSFMTHVVTEDRAALDAQIARVLERGGDFEAQFRIRTAKGHERWLLSRGRVIHDERERISRLVGVNLDITDHKRLEQALRDTDTRRNEFLAMLGHELRNPLAPITNSVRLLEKAGDDEDRRATAVQIIKRQTQHMARLVDDLLEVSRITQGRIELRMQNVLVATPVYSAIEAARPLARQKHQHIKVQIEPGDLDVVADPARLTQIISNLVMNSVKYTPRHGHIRVCARAGQDGCLELAVQDNGVGISAELMPHVFDMFTQDKRTIDRSEGGLGLGLALVKRLVELHGGTVSAESAGSGQGALFTVRVPRQGRRQELRPSTVRRETLEVTPLAILVVDDNRDAAETLAALLSMDGHRVCVAYNGPHALEVARREAPEVIFLDLGLPGIDGFEVARQMRKLPGLESAMLVALSGYAQAEDRAATQNSGFDEHLAKPADLAQVYEVLERIAAR